MTPRFSELVGCGLPLQLAAMGRIGTTELAAEVIASGGLGMVPSGVAPAGGACGINFLSHVERARHPRGSGWLGRDRRAALRCAADRCRRTADVARYAGTGVGEVIRAEPARTVVSDLMRLA